MLAMLMKMRFFFGAGSPPAANVEFKKVRV